MTKRLVAVTSDLEGLLAEVVAEVSQAPGVEAVVLGGSRARGSHTSESDVDLGIYYKSADRFDTEALDRIAAKLDVRHQSGLVTPVGGWGPWINGGGWLTVRGWQVDLLYRDLGRVERIMRDCIEGHFDIAYQPGHPHGFTSSIYMGEVAVCRPLWDPSGTLAGLKGQTRAYPPALRRAIIDRFYWEADFSLKNAAKAVPRGDVAYVAGCCFRCVACLTQCLFAANGQYWLNEKGAITLAGGFERSPERYAERAQGVFAQLTSEPAVLAKTLEDLQNLVGETGRLLSI